MHQHERPSGRPHASARPFRRPRLRLALATAAAAAPTGTPLTTTAGTATAADSTDAPKADFDGDGVGIGIGDVAFSASGAYVSGDKDAGQLVVRYGTKTGASSAKRSTISQNTAGDPGTAESGDVFGAESGDVFRADSAYADVNGDGYDDLAVSSPPEDAGTDVKLDDVTGDGRAGLPAGSYENDGHGAVLHPPSSGMKITVTGSRTVFPSASGVSTTGYPNFGADLADFTD